MALFLGGSILGIFHPGTLGKIRKSHFDEKIFFKGVGEKPPTARYDAALELCPQHKEGLVGRGAALTNLGKAREVRRHQQPDDSGRKALVVGLYGGFLKWWVSPTNPWVFLLKMIILGCEMGVPPFKETPIWQLWMCFFVSGITLPNKFHRTFFFS